MLTRDQVREILVRQGWTKHPTRPDNLTKEIRVGLGRPSRQRYRLGARVVSYDSMAHDGRWIKIRWAFYTDLAFDATSRMITGWRKAT